MRARNAIRNVAIGLLAVGLVAGAIADDLAWTPPQRTGECYVLAADFHVHAFGGDGSLTPWALRREAIRRGIDAFAITNHNQTYMARLGRSISVRSAGPLMLAGEEITARGYHIIGVGLRETIESDQPASAAIAQVHAQGGVAIAAHPTREFTGFDDAAAAALDGAERAHPARHFDLAGPQFDEFFQRARTVNADLSPIGSSDFHGSPQLGFCRTYLLARDFSEAGVLDAVRSGRTVAVDADGNLYGDEEHVALARAHGRPPPAAPQDREWLRRFSIASTWLGLLGVVLFGAARVTR